VHLAVAALDAVLHGGLPLLGNPLVGLTERGEIAGERADETHLDGAALAVAAAAAAATSGQHAAGSADAQRRAGHSGHLEEIAPRDRGPADPGAFRRFA
jgi:hypothetical protein